MIFTSKYSVRSKQGLTSFANLWKDWIVQDQVGISVSFYHSSLTSVQVFPTFLAYTLVTLDQALLSKILKFKGEEVPERNVQWITLLSKYAPPDDVLLGVGSPCDIPRKDN